MSQNDLFNENLNEGFLADTARLLLETYLKYFQHNDSKMYPYNHIYLAALNGKNKVTKPMRGLSPVKAKHLVNNGFDVKFSIEDDEWTISWE